MDCFYTYCNTAKLSPFFRQQYLGLSGIQHWRHLTSPCTHSAIVQPFASSSLLTTARPEMVVWCTASLRMWPAVSIPRWDLSDGRCQTIPNNPDTQHCHVHVFSTSMKLWRTTDSGHTRINVKLRWYKRYCGRYHQLTQCIPNTFSRVQLSQYNTITRLTFLPYGISTRFWVMATPYGASRLHSLDTPHSVGLLWASDHREAGTST